MEGVITTYKYKLRLTHAQQQRVNSWIGVSRLVYNLALDLKIQAYQKNIPLSFLDLQKQLTGIKDIDWIADVPASSLQATIQKLEKSYKNFFNGFGFPKFQSKKKGNSVHFKQMGSILKQTSGTSFNLHKIGQVKVFKDRPITGKIKTATIIKQVGKYYLCVTFEAETKTLPTSENQVGIDVGISNFAVLSDGTFVEHPKLTFKYQDELRRQQRKLSRCKLRSKNWYKQVLVVQKLQQKVKRSRADFLHKLSTDIVRNNQIVYVEKLNIRGMVRSNLSKHISDSGWYSFSQMLKYKAELYGRSFVQVPANYTSQECFMCGHIDSENRKTQSEFKCTNCGHENHADLNAACNILRRGQRLLAQSAGNSLKLAEELNNQMSVWKEVDYSDASYPFRSV